MISNYYTLAGLVREWSHFLPGAIIADIYSPRKDELALDLRLGPETQSIRISVRPGFHFIFRALRAGRPKSNVSTLFQSVIGSAVDGVEMSASDRILTFTFGLERRVDIHLYGSRANVLLISMENGSCIEEAFKRSGRLEGMPPPTPKILPDTDLREALVQTGNLDTLERRLKRLRPRHGSPVIREWIFRAGLDPDSTASLTKETAAEVARALHSVTSDLEYPSPARYASDNGEIFSLIPLTHLGTEPERTWSSLDEGVRETVRHRARVRLLESTRGSLLSALERAREKVRRKIDQLETAVESHSRADEYERWGHLLMASPQTEIADETLSVSDVLSDGSEVQIPVKPDLTTVQNAERYYEKAKGLRSERATLGSRLGNAREDFKTVEALVQEASTIRDAREVERFQKSHADALRRFIGGRSEAAPDPEPFRRFDVGGYQVWVGRNAKENDQLTFDYASPHDLWFHARGVGGSHVVLRVPGRKTVVDKSVRQEAAAIAAWFSSARGSGLVPVIVTERKYVSKPKGSDPGAVRVHRENVLMVEPHLP